jgi:hypothetical protein
MCLAWVFDALPCSLLGSNTMSHYFRGDPQVVPRLQALGPADLGVPAVVEYELRYVLQRLPLRCGIRARWSRAMCASFRVCRVCSG